MFEIRTLSAKHYCKSCGYLRAQETRTLIGLTQTQDESWSLK